MTQSRILMGVVGRPHGVQGHVHVTSYTASPADLTAYGALSDGQGRRFGLRWRSEGVAEISEIVDGKPVRVADRTAAEKLTNLRLFIERDRLPAPEEDEFYLADLVGLTAVDAAGAPLGRVALVHDYGAGASLEIAREAAAALLVPFTRACVPAVDLAAGRVIIVLPDEVEVRESADRRADRAGESASP